MTRDEKKAAWIELAIQVGKDLLKTSAFITTEEIWETMNARGQFLPFGVSARSMSAVIIRLRALGLIVPADTSPRQHRDARGVGRAPHAVRVWENTAVSA